jgi:hypothetical protein
LRDARQVSTPVLSCWHCRAGSCDRWHLLKNLREAVERVLARFASEITKVVHAPALAERAVVAPASEEARL